jgi:hypothetical protein
VSKLIIADFRQKEKGKLTLKSTIFYLSGKAKNAYKFWDFCP